MEIRRKNILEKRYVIIEQKKHGDEFEDILKAGTTEEEAKSAFNSSWDHLTAREKEKTTLQLAYLATFNGTTLFDGEIDEERNEAYKEAVAKGWDTMTGYTPILEKGVDR